MRRGSRRSPPQRLRCASGNAGRADKNGAGDRRNCATGAPFRQPRSSGAGRRRRPALAPARAARDHGADGGSGRLSAPQGHQQLLSRTRSGGRAQRPGQSPPASPLRGRQALVAVACAVALTLAVAGVTFVLGFNDGTYQLTDRSAVGIAPGGRSRSASCCGSGRAPARPSRRPWRSAALAVHGPDAALRRLGGLGREGVPGVHPGPDVSRRVRAGRARGHAAHGGRRCRDGIALGIVAVVLLALASRLWFGAWAGRTAVLLPGRSRLNYPVNYWNGLAILAGLAFPSPVAGGRRSAVGLAPSARARARAGDGGSDLPDLVAAAATRPPPSAWCPLRAHARRLSAVVATVIAGRGAGLAIKGMLARDALVNGPLGSAQARARARAPRC